eukprot:TRINITY_DN7134_c0_g1_i3.p1 TRINITY_DN7134_c0_g1~~TRINITY_DN7134_c0_g1_i3.p1  ORF type:complete len:475 (-),score=193.15 TRINITY_DN7134_c0_g1_i3:99-1523(-)
MSTGNKFFPKIKVKRKNPEGGEMSKKANSHEIWEANSEAFHIEQAKQRSEIRIKEHREKPIDFFAKIWLIFDRKLKVPEDFCQNKEYRESYIIFEKLSPNDFSEIYNDIEVYSKFRPDEDYVNYWNSLLVLCKFYEENGGSEHEVYKEGVDEAVEEDVKSFIESKTAAQLDHLEKEIRKKLVERSFLLDLQYWETILKRVKITKAKKYVTEEYDRAIKEMNLVQKKFKQESMEDDVNEEPEGDWSPVYYDRTEELEKAAMTEGEYTKELSRIWERKLQRQIESLLQNEKKQTPLSDTDALQGIIRFALEGNEYEQIAEAMYSQERNRPMAEDEEPFNELVQTGTLDDAEQKDAKYALRKPLFFNRVKVGYEWNKYHQTHSDLDNPPPKIVQGYKFNIYYPHLIDRSQPPQYYLSASDIPGTIIIRFHAGPPYEDVSFRILNKEWDLAEKRGFKSVFDRGILHLHFSFKKFRYRR